MQTGQSSIQIQDQGDQVVFQLPNRKEPELTNAGWIGLGISSVGVLFLLFWMATPIHAGIDQLKQGDQMGWFLIGFGGMGLFGLVPALGLWIASLSLVRKQTRCEVVVSESLLIDINRFGWLRWKQTYALDKVDSLLTSGPAMAHGPEDSPHAATIFGSGLQALVLQSKSGERVGATGLGYPTEVVEQLAKLLADTINRHRSIEHRVSIVTQASSKSGGPSNTGLSGDPSIDNASLPLETLETVPPKPADSRLNLVNVPDQPTVVTIPPIGFRGLPGGLFFFAVVWSIFSLVIGVKVAWQQPVGQAIAPLLLMSAFFAVGLGLMFLSWKLARGSALIGFDSQQLFWEVNGIRGKRWKQFQASEIRSVRVVDSGTEVNDRPLKVLEVTDINGQRTTDFTLLSTEELEWLAANIRVALRLPSISISNTPDWKQALSETGDFSLPEESALKREWRGSLDTLTVPPLGIFKSIPFLLFGFVALGVGVGIGYSNFPFAKEPMLGLLASVFGLAGIVVMLSGFAYTRRWFELQIQMGSPAKLTIVRHHAFSGPLTKQWTADQIRQVSIRDSGAKSNNKTIYVLSIESEQQPSFNLMWGRDEQELAAAAAFINTLLFNRS